MSAGVYLSVGAALAAALTATGLRLFHRRVAI
jgi:hypothetical protein